MSAGTLPTGLILNVSTGALTGSPTAASTFTFTLKATDANGCTGTRPYTITITGGGSATAGLQYYPLAQPVRLLDTRPDPFTSCIAANVPLGAGSTMAFNAMGTCTGIPANAKAIVGNATVVNGQSNGGYLTLYAADATQPNASNLNYTTGQIVPNAFTIGLASSGDFKVFASGATNLIIDVTGYYAPPPTSGAGGLYFHPLAAPVRLLDTRPDPFTSCIASSTPLGNASTTTLLATGTCSGIPATAKVIVGNATAVNAQSAGGYLTLFPSGTAPNASNLNYTANQVVPNAFTVGLDGAGKFKVYASGATNLIVDVTGYYDDQATGGLLFYPLSSPGRWLDTRPDPFTSCVARATPLSSGETFSVQARGRDDPGSGAGGGGQRDGGKHARGEWLHHALADGRAATAEYVESQLRSWASGAQCIRGGLGSGRRVQHLCLRRDRLHRGLERLLRAVRDEAADHWLAMAKPGERLMGLARPFCCHWQDWLQATRRLGGCFRCACKSQAARLPIVPASLNFQHSATHFLGSSNGNFADISKLDGRARYGNGRAGSGSQSATQNNRP